MTDDQRPELGLVPPAEPEGDGQDPRILAAATELVEAAGPLGLDPTPILTDARFRRLFATLRELGVLTDEQLVEIELGAIEETTEQVRAVRVELDRQALRRSLLEGVPGVPPNGHPH